MAYNERTSERVARIAARVLRDPDSITREEALTLAASALTQVPDHLALAGHNALAGPPGAHAYYNPELALARYARAPTLAELLAKGSR